MKMIIYEIAFWYGRSYFNWITKYKIKLKKFEKLKTWYSLT